MMPNSFQLSDLLEIENSPEVLTFRCRETQILVWPLVRLYFFRLIISDLMYHENPLIGIKSNYSKGKAIKSLSRGFFSSGLRSSVQQTDILIRATGAGCIKIDGTYFNKLSDHFASENPTNTAVLEDFFEWQWPEPRVFNRIIYNTPYRVFDRLKATWYRTSADFDLALSLIKWLRQRSQLLLGWDLTPKQYSWLLQQLLHSISGAKFWHRRYLQLLKAMNVKILIVEEASYGGWLACLIKAAKDIGIPTAEYQHGLISSGHDAYNFSPLLCNSTEFRLYLPDYFLSYGSWWSMQINLPSAKYTIGNPHRSTVIDTMNAHTGSRRTVLILGEGRETTQYLHFARELQRGISSEYRVVFRPHPQERFKFESTGVYANFSDVPIDAESDIYDSIRQANTVIAELSTGLFEACGIVRQILVWETSKSKFGLPNHPFISFQTLEQAQDILLHNQPRESDSIDSEDIWASNWKANYASFLKEVGL
jgi:hypothetical protein